MRHERVGKILFIIIAILMMSFVILKVPFDPDLGWHLRNGEYLLAHNLQVPKTDIYSYTMSGFPLVMHEWVTDILMYLIYSYGGLIGLVVFFTLLTVASFILVAKIVRAAVEYQLLAALLGIIAAVPILGTRAQAVTLFFIALLVFIIYRYRYNPQRKSIYFLPILFILWVNMHGGFVAGFFIVGVFLVIELSKMVLKQVYMLRKKELAISVLGWAAWRKLAVVSVISMAATILNPYFLRIYAEVYRTLTDAYARTVIQEWLPLTIQNPMSHRFLLYLALLLLLTVFAHKKIDVTYAGIAAVFLYFPFASWRHMPLFMIISIPLWVFIAQGLVGPILLRIVRSVAFLFLLFAATAFLGWQRIPPLVAIDNSVVKLAEKVGYPYHAIQYLRLYPQTGNIYNEYNWGGFLIWQYPEVKIFIDGRMAHWQKDGVRILEEDRNVAMVENWESVFTKYDVRWVLTHSDSAIRFILTSAPQKWEEVYRDPIASIIIERETTP